MPEKPNHFTVYLPAQPLEPMLLSIHAGSAIVAATRLDVSEDYLTVHYEGNLYNAVNLRTFEERVISAAGRARENYPTVACALVSPRALKEIGAFHYEQRKLTIIDPAALENWLRP